MFTGVTLAGEKGAHLVCSNCGSENPQSRRFCDSCGQSLASRCPSCGEENRGGARFCGNCGTVLAGSVASADAQPGGARRVPSAVVAERRLVTVLFADIVGFTPMAEAQDPERTRELLERYFDTARKVIERHGGVVEKFIGDAVMAVWGTPIAREDDAERAVRAALELLPQVKAVDESLQARAGVLTGEAAVSVGGINQAMVAGDLVNTAARLQSVAQPDTVLVGEATMQATRGAIAFEPAGETSLKGKAATVPAWRALRVVAERGGRARSSTIEAPFVGRDAELNLLKNLLHTTQQDGRSRLVAVMGPGGIGKSRLAWELEKYVDGLVGDVYWHRGRSPSYGEGITFWALGEMVRRRAGLAEADDEAATRRGIARAMEAFVPADEERRWIEPALLALLGVEPPPAGGRDVLFAAWRTFFERIAARGLTVLVFEDLQWADTGLLDFIDNLLEWSKSAPIFVLALARPELLERRADFGSATRQFTSMPLGPLSDAHMGALLAGLAPGLPADAAATIVSRADGIPLYAVETVRMLVADGRLQEREGAYQPSRELGELAIPDTLRSLIASRLDALDAADRSLLQRAAVLGQTFTSETLAAISEDPSTDLDDRLRRLVRRDILYVQADPRSPERGQYGFVQSLIREVAYGMLARRERRERHLAAARHFEGVGDDELAGVLASHYVAALAASEQGPEADAVATQARLALRGAADRAAALGAHGQAAGHLRRALEVTSADAERGDLLERLANALDNDGRYAEAVDTARAAAAAYQAAGQPEAGARVAIVLAAALLHSARPLDAVTAVTAVLPASGTDSELQARLLARLSRAHMVALQGPPAIEAADKALQIAETHAMTDVFVDALNNKGAALDILGRWREGVLLLEGALKLADGNVDPELYLRIANNLASVVGLDDPRRAHDVLADGVELARRWGIRSGLFFMINHLTSWMFHTGGEFETAEALLSEAYDQASDDADRAFLWGNLTLYRLTRGELDETAISRWESLASNWEPTAFGNFRSMLKAFSAIFTGDLETGYASILEALHYQENDVGAMGILLDLAVALGDADRVREAAARVLAHSHTGRVILLMKTWAGACVAAIDGRPAEAIAGFHETDRRASEIGYEFWRSIAALDAITLMPERTELRAAAEVALENFKRWHTVEYVRRTSLLLGVQTSVEPALATKATLRDQVSSLAPSTASTT